VVGLGDKVSPTDIEEGMRVGYIPGSLFSVLPSLLAAFKKILLFGYTF
jgi:hypothetical protein